MADDPRITAGYVEYNSPNGHGTIRAYQVRPSGVAADARIPAVIVVHQNRGVNPHIEDVARRIALEGFMAFAPDGLSGAGGYPGDDDTARDMQRGMDRGKLREDFMAAFDHLKADPGTNGRIGVIGFCYGGGIANAMAVRHPDLAAAVPFYGSQPAAEDVPKIQAPLLLHYAGLDERINAGWPAYEEALKANGKEYHRPHLSRRQSRLPRRHVIAIRRGCGDAGLGAHHRVPEGEAGLSSAPCR